MKNTHFNLSSYTISDYSIKDIFSEHKNKKMDSSIITNNPTFWYYKNIQDNSRLDLLSYKEYENSGLWDILFIINQMDNVWDLPKDTDYISAMVEDKMQEFVTLFGEARLPKTVTNNPPYYKYNKESELYDEFFIKNEKYRKFRFIYKSQIPNLINILKNQH